MERFPGKVVLVTGTAWGIGESAARQFEQEGATLVLADMNGEGLREAAGGISAAEVMAEVADLSKAPAFKTLVAEAKKRFGRLDVLVDNAGKDHLGQVDEGDIDCAAKGAVTNFTRAVATDDARHGLRVNAVNPSLVYTPFTAGMQDPPELIAAFEERIPMRRGATPGDTAAPSPFWRARTRISSPASTCPSTAAPRLRTARRSWAEERVSSRVRGESVPVQVLRRRRQGPRRGGCGWPRARRG